MYLLFLHEFLTLHIVLFKLKLIPQDIRTYSCDKEGK
jgi:hypothetical protein